MTISCRLPLLAAAALLTVGDGVSLRAVPHESSGQAAAPVRLYQEHRSSKSAARAMSVLGHRVSKVSERWGSNVVYAIFTSAIPKYREELESQLETWAARPAEEGRYVAVGGENYPDAWQSGSILRSNCSDDVTSISCKEATLLAEGAARGADWLVVVGEDNYVYTRHVEAFLADKDPDMAVAYGRVGCGKGLFCLDNEFFSTFGGFCGGAGYIISRAALQRLVADGAPALHKVYDNTTNANDMTTSCELAKLGAQLHHTRGMNGYPLFMIQQFVGAAQSDDILTSHYVPRDAMRWLHAVVENKEESLQEGLQREAFEHGCARGMNNRYWAKTYSECVRVNSKFFG